MAQTPASLLTESGACHTITEAVNAWLKSCNPTQKAEDPCIDIISIWVTFWRSGVQRGM